MMHIVQFLLQAGADQAGGHVTPPAFLGILLGAALSFAIWGVLGLALL